MQFHEMTYVEILSRGTRDQRSIGTETMDLLKQGLHVRHMFKVIELRRTVTANNSVNLLLRLPLSVRECEDTENERVQIRRCCIGASLHQNTTKVPVKRTHR